MPLPPWTIEVLRKGIGDIARKARQPETYERIKSHASGIIQDLPETAAKGIDAVLKSAENRRKSVERWARKQTTLAVPMINASGQLIHPFGTGVPIDEAVADTGNSVLLGDVIVDQQWEAKIARRFTRVLPAGMDQTVAVASSFEGALSAFSLVGVDIPLVIHRNHSIRLFDGTPLVDVLNGLCPVVTEVGALGHVRQQDYEGLDQFCSVIADSGDREIELLDLPEHEFLQAVVLPVATLDGHAASRIPSVLQLLSQGVDFVITPGDGPMGGPASGLIFGNAQAVELIRASSLWRSFAACPVTQAMAMTALEVASSSEQSPIGSLLDTSEDNLRGRAERIATRLSGCDAIASCQVSADEARVAEGRWTLPSRQVRIRHANQSASDWAESLRQSVPAVLATIEGDDLKLDLRWVPASDDSKLVESLGGASMEPPSNPE